MSKTSKYKKVKILLIKPRFCQSLDRYLGEIVENECEYTAKKWWQAQQWVKRYNAWCDGSLSVVAVSQEQIEKPLEW